MNKKRCSLCEREQRVHNFRFSKPITEKDCVSADSNVLDTPIVRYLCGSEAEEDSPFLLKSLCRDCIERMYNYRLSLPVEDKEQTRPMLDTIIPVKDVRCPTFEEYYNAGYEDGRIEGKNEKD